jgi:hypothetical protein
MHHDALPPFGRLASGLQVPILTEQSSRRLLAPLPPRQDRAHASGAHAATAPVSFAWVRTAMPQFRELSSVKPLHRCSGVCFGLGEIHVLLTCPFCLEAAT